MTFEEAARLDPDEQPGELDQGRWLADPRGAWRHGEIIGNVCVVLKSYQERHAGWSVAAGRPGVKLHRNPDTLRGPDVARVPAGKGAEGWLDGAPEVAVEIIGDTHSISKTTGKALQYMAAGARLVWGGDVNPQCVLVFTPPDHVRLVGAEETLDGGDVLPDFSCAVVELFE